jgi:hypothetical protein
MFKLNFHHFYSFNLFIINELHQPKHITLNINELDYFIG